MNKIVALVTGLLFFINSTAQQAITSILSDTINLDEVVVTGTTVRVSRNSLPLAVSVVNKKQIMESTETALLPILNGRVPGLFVTERGIMGFGVSTGAAGQISIRGVGGSPTTGVLMLIDGHPQFMGIFGHPLPDSYVASDVEKVEVIRGPGSVLYGSNAMGGVVNIITRKQAEDGFHGNAHLMYGSYNTQKYMASGGYKKNGLSVFASVNHGRTDGHRENSEFYITNGYAKLGYEFNSNLKMNADFSLANFNTTDPGPDTTDAKPGNNLDITRGYWAVSLDNKYDKHSGTIKLFYNFGEHRISDGFHSNDKNYGLNVYESIRLFKGNNITVGADYLNYGGIADNEKYGTQITDTSLYDAGIYAFIQQNFSKKVTLNAGLRMQRHEIYGTEWIPAGGFTFRIGKNTTWKVSVAKGFRSPTIRELFVWNHNVSLSPERIMNYETGILRSFSKQGIKLEVTAFMVNGDNMIITVPMQGLQNAGKVSNKGLELAAGINPSENLELSLTYSYTHMKYTVYATPRHNLFASISHSWKNLNSSLSIQHIDHLDTDPAAGRESFENYTLVNSKVAYRILPWWEVFINAENILNQKYENNIYYTMPGITVFGGMKFRI
ncbi:MAG: TonB-dependent receptor [Bacteroidales bacterium]|nr:TonB-dependent receptor [Bacteroidales bacterium]